MTGENRSEPYGSVDGDGEADDPGIALADRLARKYFVIWIWSVVVGIVTTNSLSIWSFHPSARGPLLILLIGPLMAICGSFTIGAWWFILRFLQGYILPVFFWERENEPRRRAAALGTAVQMTVFAVIFRLLLAVADFYLEATGF